MVAALRTRRSRDGPAIPTPAPISAINGRMAQSAPRRWRAAGSSGAEGDADRDDLFLRALRREETAGGDTRRAARTYAERHEADVASDRPYIAFKAAAESSAAPKAAVIREENETEQHGRRRSTLSVDTGG